MDIQRISNWLCGISNTGRNACEVSRPTPHAWEQRSVVGSPTGLGLQFRAEALNLFNRSQFGYPNVNCCTTSFGTISGQTNAPRQIQFALKMSY